MNMKRAAIILTVLYLLVNANNAQAQTAQARAVNDVRKIDLLPEVQVKRDAKAQCHIHWWYPELWYYLDDDGGEPGQSPESSYQDYLSDLGGFYQEYPDVCQIPLEVLPE
jgi:hypothetical protein